MASCSYCNSFILFGGRTDTTGRYCDEKCQRTGNLLALAQRIPQHELDRLVQAIHQGDCPRCGRHGPVDMHKAYRVWSALVLTSWSSSPALSCKSCATKRQAGALLFSGVLGWWGFPWGIVMTPVQVVRNLAEMVGGPRTDKPTPLLEKFVRIQAAATLVQRSQERHQQSTPAPAPDNDERYMPKS
jgi:hypothetical protein